GCTHEAIFPPKINDPIHPEAICVNRKRYHSLNVQLVCFIDRDTELLPRQPEGLTKERAIITKDYNILKWFAELKDYLRTLGTVGILEDPSRILNRNETSFSFCPKTGKVLAPMRVEKSNRQSGK